MQFTPTLSAFALKVGNVVFMGQHSEGEATTPREQDTEDETAESERRVAKRHFACFPVYIDDGIHKKRTAVIRDMSASGTRLLTRARLLIGDRVTLSLYLTEDLDNPLLTDGIVVRVENRDPDVMGIWPFSAAVEFDTSLEQHEEAIRAVEARQNAIGLPRA